MTPPIPPDGGGRAEVRAEGLRWRERVLSNLFRVGVVVLAVAAVWLASMGSPRSAALFVVVAATALVVSHSTRIAFPIRVAYLLATLVGAAALTMLSYGPTPSSVPVLCTAVVFATILMGRRWGLATVGLSVGLVGLIASLHANGLVDRSADWAAQVDVARPTVALRVMSLLLLLGMALVLAPSALLRRTEALAVEKARSLDLLESEQRESARREAAYRKAQELELLGRITGTVAHDFNNTLTVVLAAVAELERKPSSADVTEVLADLRSAALAATCSVQHLQVFGPPRTTQRTEIPVAALLERSCAGLRRALPKTIEVKLEILAEPVVRANEGHLQQVFANLALNARDAMRKGGRLTLRVREVEGGAWAAVDVIDTGVGMSDEVKEHLFEPFFTTKGDHGTGLGLAAVKERVQAEGGRIAVTSEVGAGTTITVSLPAIRRGIADG